MTKSNHRPGFAKLMRLLRRRRVEALTLLLSLGLLTTFAASGFVKPTLAANPASDLDQCRNGAVVTSGTQTFVQCKENPAGDPNKGWVNGNAGAADSHYAEGESISYRTSVTGLTSGDSVELTIGYDVIHSGHHAIDYLTDANRWQTPETSVGATPDLPCDHSPAFCTGSPTNVAIPAPTTNINADPTKALGAGCLNGSTGASQPVTSFNAIPAAQRVMEFFNVTGTPTIAYVGPAPNLTATTGDQEQQVKLTFTANSSTVVIAWGGHISRRLDWGCTDQALSAAGISGSPYHMRLKDMTVNGTHVNLGNQDRSLSAQAVPEPFTLIIKKTAVGGDATFNYATTGSDLPGSFSLTTSGGTASTTFF